MGLLASVVVGVRTECFTSLYPQNGSAARPTTAFAVLTIWFGDHALAVIMQVEKPAFIYLDHNKALYKGTGVSLFSWVTFTVILGSDASLKMHGILHATSDCANFVQASVGTRLG
jgi:hypothetical protein